MLSVGMLSVGMLSVGMLRVVMLSDAAPINNLDTLDDFANVFIEIFSEKKQLTLTNIINL